MTTLESRYEERLRALQGTRQGGAGVSDEEVQYMLDTVPFIKDYTTTQTSTAANHALPGSRVSKHTTGIDSFVTIKHKNNRNLVFQQYLVEVEKNTDAAQMMPSEATRLNDETMTCPHCNQPFMFNRRESELVCRVCGTAQTHMEMSEHNITYDQEVQQNSIVNYFAYKRLNHFTEWLNSVQAKENTDIPPEVLDAVRAEFKKERASKRGDIKPSKVRAFLKKLKLNKFYEHTHNICNALNGVPAPKLPQYLEDRLKHMFGEIQEPFEKWCPPTRKNFLSYGYVLFKFCELLGEVSHPISGRAPRVSQYTRTHRLPVSVCRRTLSWKILRCLKVVKNYMLKKVRMGGRFGVLRTACAIRPMPAEHQLREPPTPCRI